MLGGILGLLAAATFAFNNASARRGVLTGSVAQAMAITVPIGVPIFFIAALLFGYLPTLLDFTPTAAVWLSLAGIVHFVWGRYCNYRATKAMGANLVGPVQQTSLILTLVLAMWILGESLTPLRLIGISLVILGPAMTLPGNGAPHASAPRFDVRYKEGYVWALLSATGYGVSPILVRLALEHKGLGSGLIGGLVAYSAATVVLGLILLATGQMRHVIATGAEATKWFTLSGVLVCLSQMFLYMAYAVAPVTVVSPIQRLSNVFRIHAGWMLNPHHEVFGSRVILGTVVSLFGALALSVSTDVVLSFVPVPDFVAAVAHWHWP